MSGFAQTDGLYERQADKFNNDVYYLRTNPTTMYAYRNPHSAGNDNWHFRSQLGSEVSLPFYARNFTCTSFQYTEAWVSSTKRCPYDGPFYKPGSNELESSIKSEGMYSRI